MKVIHLSYPLSPSFVTDFSSIAIGYFDGVHYGHQGVIKEAVRYAKKTGLKSAVMTFDPHPRQLFGNNNYTASITPLPDKLRIFENLGVDITYVVSFCQVFSKISPLDFVEQFLLPLRATSVTVGFDFSFGYRGAAGPYDLQNLAKERFRVEIISSINSSHEKISSTNIRKALQDGDIEKINNYLGREYTISGKLKGSNGEFFLTRPFLLPQAGEYWVKIYALNRWVYSRLKIYNSLYKKCENGKYQAQLFLLTKDLLPISETIEVRFISLSHAEQIQDENETNLPLEKMSYQR
ncbi:Riboflavin biosynthesis protein RibF [compost metagenome]